MNKRQHKLYDKSPIVSMIIFGIIGALTTQILSLVINSLLGMISPTIFIAEGPVGVIAASVITLLIIRLWFKGEYKGSVIPCEFNKQTAVIIAAYILTMVFSLSSLIINHISLQITYLSLCTAIFAGVLEETLFRGVLISVLMRRYKDGNILVPLFISSAVFGLVHIANIFSGAGVAVTILQLIVSLGVGLALGAIYLLTGNILITMLIHAAHDVIALSIPGNTTESGVMTANSISLTDCLGVLPQVILGAIAVFIMTRPKTKEIVHRIWNKKWNITP